MILSEFDTYSDEQAETTIAAHASTNVLDHGAAGDAVGRESNFVLTVPEACTSAGAATVQFTLETDSDEAFGSAETLWDSGAIAIATLVKDYKVAGFKMPSGCKRYTRVVYTIGAFVLTAGKFNAFLTNDMQANDFTV